MAECSTTDSENQINNIKQMLMIGMTLKAFGCIVLAVNLLQGIPQVCRS